MNNYEAIEWMKVRKQCIIECPDDASKEVIEAYNMAIEALENQNDCKDCAGCTQWMCECANVKAEVCNRIVEQLEECSRIYCKEYGYAKDENVLYLPDAIAIVKGVQNE